MLVCPCNVSVRLSSISRISTFVWGVGVGSGSGEWGARGLFVCLFLLVPDVGRQASGGEEGRGWVDGVVCVCVCVW